MFKKDKFNNLILNSLVGIIIFLLPTNFFLKFFETEAYVNGLRVDYLISKLYLSDIFIIVLLLFGLIDWLRRNSSKDKVSKLFKVNLTRNPFLFSLLAIFFIRQFFTLYLFASVVYLLRIILMALLATFLYKNKTKIYSELIDRSVIAALFFQSSVAIYQYVNQKTLLGYAFLGEPNLNNYIGISKSEWLGIERILPYGTTAHPNILGGFLALYLLYLFNKTGWKSTSEFNSTVFVKTQSLIVCLTIVALFLTQSVSAILTFILGLCFIFYQKYSKKTEMSLQKIFNLKNVLLMTLGLFLISIISINLLSKEYPKNQSLNRRSYLNNAALEMIKDNFITGVGLNNFTSKVEYYSDNREIVRFVQPTHNIILLFLAETGILGSATLGLLIHKIFFKNQPSIFYRIKILQKRNRDWWWILVLLPIALLDHYFLTSNAGMLLLVFSAELLGESN